jgi:diazepam-binding inhibitor (GABA receptor modulating acyl-CoA-binding protein)
VENSQLELTEIFNETVAYVQSSESKVVLNSQLKLKMYALYKQATQGDVSGEKPTMINMVALAKFMAWEKLQGMTATIAMQNYIDEVNEIKTA